MPRRSSSPVRRRDSPRKKSPSRIERSPSPRTKRLRKGQDEQEAKKVTHREHERNDNRERERVPRREKDSDREDPRERDDRRLAHEKNDNRERERVTRREKDSEWEDPRERGDRRLPRDNGGKSSRPRHDLSPKDRRKRDRYVSQSPPKVVKNGPRDEEMDTRDDEPNQDDDSVVKMKAAEEALEAKKKDKPSFELSGKLADETNRVKGITLLFNEPPDARKPNVRWRLYVFKAGDVLNEPLYIHRQTCYLFGRERRVADIPTDHPSCSKQHAVIQFRQVEKERPDGMLVKHIRPYIMDLGSTNGTFINENRIEPQRYYELIEKDTIKFGNSSREYVILHEDSAE